MDVQKIAAGSDKVCEPHRNVNVTRCGILY